MRRISFFLVLPLLPLLPACSGLFTVGASGELVLGTAGAPRADVRILSSQIREVQGWRTVRGTDGSSVLVDVNLDFVVDASGRAIRVAENGSLFVVGHHGRQEPVLATDAVESAARIEIDVQIALGETAGWRTATTNSGVQVLVGSAPSVVMTAEGEPVCVAPSGDLYVVTGQERFAIDASAYADARVELNVDVQIELNVSAMAGFRVAAAGESAKILVNAEGELLLDEAGRFVHVDEGGIPFVVQGGVRIELNVALPDIVALLSGARIEGSVDAQATATSVLIAADAPPGEAIEALPTAPSTGSSDAGADIEVNAHVAVAIPAPGQPGRDAEAVGGPSGVSAIGGGRATFNMLLQGEVRVDGFRLGLGDLGPIAPLTAHAQADAVQTGPEIHVHAGLEHVQLPRAGGETNLVVELEGGQAPSQAQTKVRLHLVIDRSSSMQSSWRDVLGAAELLLGELRASDSVQIVAYGTDVQEVLPLQRAGNGRAAVAALRRISVGGGTNIEVGLRAAYGAASGRPLVGNERSLVILLSDGVPNGGAFTADALAPMARRAMSGSACTTTVIGLGNQFDPAVLRAIAAAGQGSYHVARGTAELAPMLRAELRAQQNIAVRDVQVRLRLAGGVQLLDGGRVDASGNVVIDMPQLRQGEQRRMELRVRVPAGSAPRSVGRIDVGYRSGNARASGGKDLLMAFGSEAQLASAGPAFVIADKDLGRALDLAANAVLNGQASAAANALSAHVARIEARADFDTHRALQARTIAAGRFAQAVRAITPRASHSERRVFSLAMGELASSLLR